MACRGCLRDILSRYLDDTAPAMVRLGKNNMGKPIMADARERYFFNVAHTGETGLIAVSNTAAVGVDVELSRRNIRNLHSLIKRRCTECEGRQLIEISTDNAGTIQDDVLQYNFLKLWTCKEAFVKCTGEGIARGLKTFEVTSEEGIPQITNLNGKSEATNRWSIHEVEVDEHHVAAMVTATRRRATLRYLDWNATEGDLHCS